MFARIKTWDFPLGASKECVVDLNDYKVSDLTDNPYCHKKTAALIYKHDIIKQDEDLLKVCDGVCYATENVVLPIIAPIKNFSIEKKDYGDFYNYMMDKNHETVYLGIMTKKGFEYAAVLTEKGFVLYDSTK